jgi:hypothetical protein
MNKNAYETGSAAIAYEFDPEKSAQVVCVKLHLSAVGGAVENFTITEDSVLGAEFDVVHVSQDMNAVADLVWRPEDGPLNLSKGSKLVIAYTNTNARTYGLEIEYR